MYPTNQFQLRHYSSTSNLISQTSNRESSPFVYKNTKVRTMKKDELDGKTSSESLSCSLPLLFLLKKFFLRKILEYDRIKLQERNIRTNF